MGCIDLRRPSVSRPRTYSSPAARWSLRASPPSIPPANSASRGRTSAICSGVIPAREYEEPRNRGRVTSILNKVLVERRRLNPPGERRGQHREVWALRGAGERPLVQERQRVIPLT